MSRFNLTNATTPDQVLIGLADSVKALPIMLLFFTWFMVFFSGVQRQSRRFGYADMPQWAALASLSCVLLGLVMTTTAGLLDLTSFVIVMSVAILSGVWFFLSRGRYE